MTIIYFIIMLGLLISIHEAGHMLVAKAFGLYVKEYAIGFGPQIWSYQGKETKYSLRLIPLGGYTGLIESEEDNVSDEEETEGDEQQVAERTKKKIVVDESRTFYGANPWKRIAVLLAGPLSNILLAFLIFIILFTAMGQEVVYPKAVVGQVVANSPAEKAGVEVDDEIVSIRYANGDTVVVNSTEDISINNSLHKGAMTLTILRDGQTIEVTLTPEYNETEKRSLIGVVFAGEATVRKLSFGEGVLKGITYTVDNIGLTLKSIVLLITGQAGMENLSGTIGIYSYTKEAVSYGFLSYLSLIGSISVSLAIMNLIPIPVFDGGRIVMTVIEMILGHRMSKKAEEAFMLVGLALVLLLFVFVTVLDVSKLINS